MKRRLDVTPQARRDFANIITWYRDHLGGRAALKVAKTLQSRLSAMEAGQVRGGPLRADSRFTRVVAKRHIIIFLAESDAIRVVRIVHAAQDLDAIAAELEG